MIAIIVIQVLGDLSLVISDVQLEDAQQYVCEASNALGSDIDLALLTVLGKLPVLQCRLAHQTNSLY